MDEKLKIIPFIFLFLIVFISAAQPVQLNVNTNVGLDVTYSQYEYAKVDTAFQLNIHVYNKSTGLKLDNTTTNCTLHLYHPNGSHLWIGTFDYDLVSTDFNIDIDANNFTLYGIHAYEIDCESTDIGGFASGKYDVNYLGKAIDTPQAILYGFFFLIIFFFMFALIFIIDKLPSSNTRDEEGKILSISYLKYLRGSLWFFEWMLLIGILYLASNLAFAFLTEQLFANILLVLFKITFGLTPVIVIVWVIWIIVNMFHDKELQNLLNRGFFPQGKI